jgi:hypothetical protein
MGQHSDNSCQDLRLFALKAGFCRLESLQRHGKETFSFGKTSAAKKA